MVPCRAQGPPAGATQLGPEFLPGGAPWRGACIFSVVGRSLVAKVPPVS